MHHYGGLQKMVKELAKGSTMDDELKDIRSLAGSILNKIKSILVARGIPKCTNSKDILDEQYTRLKLISTRLYQAKEELDEFWHSYFRI